MVKHTLEKLWCEQRKNFEVCLTIFQHYMHERINAMILSHAEAFLLRKKYNIQFNHDKVYFGYS